MWFRVNDLLPVALQKSLPDRPPGMPEIHEGNDFTIVIYTYSIAG